MKPQDFDRAFAKEAVRDHEKDISKYRKEAKNGKNEEVKQYAAETLPTLEEHLKLARDLSSAQGSKSAKGKAGG